MKLFIWFRFVFLVLVVRIIAIWIIFFGRFVLFSFWRSPASFCYNRRRRLFIITFNSTIFLECTFWSAATTFFGRRIFSRTCRTRIFFFWWSRRCCCSRTLLRSCLSNYNAIQLHTKIQQNGKHCNFLPYSQLRRQGGRVFSIQQLPCLTCLLLKFNESFCE